MPGSGTLPGGAGGVPETVRIAIKAVERDVRQARLVHREVSGTFLETVRCKCIAPGIYLLSVTNLQRIDPSKATHVATVNDFIFDVGIDNQNLWDTSAWMDASGIVRKLIGFMDKNMEDAGKGADSSFTALAAFKSFFFSLTNANDDGRVVIMPSTSSLRYLNLNPSSSFSAVVKDARAVILAGGTMRPYSFYVDQLFPGRSVHTFSCGHVVAPDNVAAIVIGTGPTGRSLNFRFTSRSQLDTLMELGRTLVNLCSIAPAGLVCFFSSYAYEDAVFKFLDSNGFLQRIRSRKSVHREPRDAADVGSTLTRFSEAVARAGGAMLSCVVGGKMSEGINFSDDLARVRALHLLAQCWAVHVADLIVVACRGRRHAVCESE